LVSAWPEPLEATGGLFAIGQHSILAVIGTSPIVVMLSMLELSLDIARP